MTTLDKAQWAQVQNQLGHAYGRVKLIVDGLHVTFETRRMKPLEYTICVFVNGVMNWGEMRKEGPVRDLVMRPVTRGLYTKAEIARLQKSFGKRGALKYFPKLLDTRTDYEPFWSSPRSLCAHLKRTATSIQLVDEFPAVAETTTPAEAAQP
jgi:hypothetical protein